MAELGINDNLIGWTKLFLINRELELVIDRYTNLKQKVEMRILQRLPVSPSWFLIYINGMFSQIIEKLPGILFISFVDYLSF